jgi:hypothetical protein
MEPETATLIDRLQRSRRRWMLACIASWLALVAWLVLGTMLYLRERQMTLAAMQEAMAERALMEQVRQAERMQRQKAEEALKQAQDALNAAQR